MNYFRLKDNTQELNELYSTGFTPGVDTGWSTIDDYLTLKKGYPMFVAGAPHSGKTEFILELMVSLSLRKGWKWFVYTGEAGSIVELISELAYKIIGKPYARKEINGHTISMTDSEKTYSEYLIDEHFFFLDTEDPRSSIKDFTVDDYYKIVDEAEAQFGVKFDGTLIDPWNDVVNETLKHGGREDLWLADALKTVRRDAKSKQRLNIVINHISDVKPVVDKDTGRRYYPAALPSEWAGGRTWWRRAYIMLLIYRPPSGLNDPETGVPYKPNESHIYIQKAKPKGIAKLGKVILYWDWKTNRYYEDESLLRSPLKKSAPAERSSKIEPNTSFSNKVENEDDPF